MKLEVKKEELRLKKVPVIAIAWLIEIICDIKFAIEAINEELLKILEFDILNWWQKFKFIFEIFTETHQSIHAWKILINCKPKNWNPHTFSSIRFIDIPTSIMPNNNVILPSFYDIITTKKVVW
jgi:hypothetical protein